MTTRHSFTTGAIAVTTAPTNLYVSDINGDDGYDGLTPATALATVQEAADRLGGVLGYVAIIHVGRHSGAGYAPPRVQSTILNANLWFVGDGAGQAGETGFTSIRASVAAAAGSSVATIAVTGGGMVVDAYRGQTVRVTTGAAAGDYRTIRNNDATNLYPVRPFSAAVAAGDLYEVVEPDVIWNFDTPFQGQDPILVGNMNGGLGQAVGFQYGVYFNNFKWTGPATSIYTIYGSRVVLAGIQCDTVNANVQAPLHQWNSSVVGLGQDQQGSGVGNLALFTAALNDGMGAVSTTSWLGWTLSQRNPACTGIGLSLTGSLVHGSVVTNAVSVSAGANYACNGGNFFGGGTTAPSFSANNGGSASLVGPSAALNILISGAGATNGALQTSAGGTIIGGSFTLVTNTAGPGIRATTFGKFTGLSSGVTGTGTTFGCQADIGGQILWSNTAPTVLGVAGVDITVDATGVGGLGVSFTAATLAAAGDHIMRTNGALIARI